MDLKLQGLALRARWEWLRRTDNSRPWFGLPMMKGKEVELVFRSLASVKLGRGNLVLFWTDRWINGASVVDLAPNFLKAVGSRQRNLAEGLLDNAWVCDITRALDVEGVAEVVRLWMACNSVQLDLEADDSFS